MARETPPPRQPLPPPLGPRRSEHPSRTGQPEDSGSDVDRHPLGARVQGQGGGLSSIPDPSGVSALPRRRRVWWRRGWGWEELEGGSGRRRLDGVYGLRRGRWTGPRTGTQRAHPRPGQPSAALLAASRATPTPVPAPPPGGGAPHPPAAPSPMPRAPRGAQVDPAVSVSHPGPGQDAGQGRGAGRGARRVLPRAPAGVPAPGLRHSGSGSGAQAVPGGGALESGLEFSPNTQAAGWAAAVGSGSRPGRRCGRWVRAQGDQGAADLEPCLEADREISVLRGFGRRM